MVSAKSTRSHPLTRRFDIVGVKFSVRRYHHFSDVSPIKRIRVCQVSDLQTNKERTVFFSKFKVVICNWPPKACDIASVDVQLLSARIGIGPSALEFIRQ